MTSPRSRRDLAGLLARSVGEAVAAAEIGRAADELGFGAELSADQALAVLERLTCDEGLVGIAARFAKARVHLAWAA